jgi:hypothetical protein
MSKLGRELPQAIDQLTPEGHGEVLELWSWSFNTT